MKQYVVIGLGRFGASVAKTLFEKGQQVIAIDKDEELVHDVMEFAAKAVCLDSIDEKAVRSVGVDRADVAICGIGTDVESSILVTLLLKDLGIPVIVCKASSLAHKKVLEKIGATKVILPEKDTGKRIAETLVSVSETVLDHIGLPGDASIIELVVPEEFTGKTLRELDIRSAWGANIIAVKKKGTTVKDGEETVQEKVNVTPRADDVIVKGDILIIFGGNDEIEKIRERFQSK
jgi:trk system potassium uptake protein